MNDFRFRVLQYFVVLIIVFLAGISFHLERVEGWGVFLLCFVVASLGAWAFSFAKRQVQSAWSRLSGGRKFFVFVSAVALFVVLCFATNFGKPDATSRDLVDLLFLTAGLALWGCYRLFSRFLDWIWLRLRQ